MRNHLRIGVIGAGITGLTAAYELGKKGHSVTVFERSAVVGGLGTYIPIVGSFLERYYHHFFESDVHVASLIRELGIGDKLKFYPSKTSVFYDEKLYPFDSPFHLLAFKPLSLINRLRLGAAIAHLKYNPLVSNERLDKISAVSWLKKYAGKQAYEVVWQPLLEGKFSRFAREVPAAWLKDRVRDRSFKLGYLAEGTKTLFDVLQDKIKKQGNTILLECEVQEVREMGERVLVQTANKKYKFDVCLMTSVSPITEKLVTSTIEEDVRKNLLDQDQLGAVCVTLELNQSVQPYYWINICDMKSNVLVAVEHTNMIDKKQYDNHHIMYLANYIHRSEKRFQQSDEEIVKEYTQVLKRLNPSFDPSWIIKSHVSRAPRTQTIFSRGALHNRPPKQLSPRIYLGNIDQMYPHDRNLNLGVELARQLSAQIEGNKLI